MVGKRITLRYALALDCADPYGLADDVLLPLDSGLHAGRRYSTDAGSMLSVHGAEVSALRRVAQTLELRVFNPSAEETTVSLPGSSGWLVDLRGYPERPSRTDSRYAPSGSPRPG